MNLPEIIAQERKHERISAVVTTITVIIFLILALLDHFLRSRTPQIAAKEYEVVGAIDFGDYREGSRSVNNFQPAVENPAPAPSAQQPSPQPTPPSNPAPQPTPPSSTPAPSNVQTTPDLSPVSQPSTPAEPKPTPAPPRETTQPSPQPTETTNNNNSSSQAPPQEELEFTFESNSGSNQGNQSSGVGNQGTPDVKVLDPNGLYSFAEGGEGGLDGRRPLALPEPRYTSQEEGRLTFELTIRPDGSVSYVKVVGVTNKASLKQAGINAIKRWRFSPLPPGSAQVTQRVRVSVTFKLRG